MTSPSNHGPLGHAVAYANRYDPGLLFVIPRAANREKIGITATLPFCGVDIWNAYELSWLDARGKPAVALAQFRFPATSPNIIESKSFKLYLNSFNNEPLGDAATLRGRLLDDLSGAAGAPVTVALTLPPQFADCNCIELPGTTIDDQVIDIDDYGPPNAAHLQRAIATREIKECLTSQLLKSNCPVTGQPDWASVQIRYTGVAIDHAGLLRYLVSFRNHAEFHEHCVERIFVDVMQRCAPSQLSVYARYTRRGGLDINPWRSTAHETPPNLRGSRQ